MIKYEELRKHMTDDPPELFGKFLEENVEIVDYIPLGRKTAILDTFSNLFAIVLSGMMSDSYSTLADMYMEYEIRKVFYLLFEYTNIETDAGYMNNMEYDLIMQSGLYNVILQTAREDYERLCVLADDIVGLRDISLTNHLSQMITVPTIENMDKMIDKVNDIDRDVLNKLYKIQQMNDPILAEIIKGGKVISMEEAERRAKEHKNGKKV